MKQRKISKTNVVNFSTYLGMVIFFLVMTALSKAGVLNRSMTGLLVPICCYMSMAVSLNLTVGILGELSLGHAGFMSVGAFAGVIASQSLLDVVPSAGLRLTIAMIVGALLAGDVEHDFARVHHQRAVAKIQRLVHVVRDHQAGDVPLGHHAAGEIQHLVRRGGVEGGGVLVEQQQLGRDHRGHQHGQRLALTC